MTERDRSIYVVISRTGTLLCRAIGLVSGGVYNHASLSLDESLSLMYSFGRVNPYNPIVGGFVKESPFFGTFKRFHGTEVIVYRIPVTRQQKEALETCLHEMYAKRDRYGYNFLGLFVAAFGIYWKRENRYYCSEFVRDILAWYSVLDARLYYGIVKPEDFAAIPGAERIYCGNLRKYAMRYQNRRLIPQAQLC